MSKIRLLKSSKNSLSPYSKKRTCSLSKLVTN
jgi:hypothetical protein